MYKVVIGLSVVTSPFLISFPFLNGLGLLVCGFRKINSLIEPIYWIGSFG